MTDKCKLPTCENKLVHTEGRRPKEFCSPKCRTLFHNLKKVKGVGRGRPKGSKNKIKYPKGVTVVTEEIKEIVGAVSSAGFCQPYNNPTNPLTNAPRERDESGVNEDEIKYDFSKVVFFQIEDFTEYPKDKCPAKGFERTEYLAKKKEADDKIREAYRIYKSKP